MRRNLWLIAVAVCLLLAGAAPVVYAQGDGGDKFVFNETFVLSAGETLHGRLAVANGAATLEAGSVVSRDVAAFGSNLTIAGTVFGNVAAFGGQVYLAKTAVIEGDFAAFGAEVVQEPGAVIRGERVSGDRRAPDGPSWPPASGGRDMARKVLQWQLGTLGSVLLLGLLGVAAVTLAPQAVGRVAQAARANPALNFGLGLLTLIVAGLAGALLLIACGLGLLVWLALMAACLLGWIAVGLWLGQRLLVGLRVRAPSALGQVVAGVALLTLIARFPWCIGFLFSLVVGSIGLGAVIVTRFGTQSPDEPVAPAPRPPAPEIDALSLPPSVSDDEPLPLALPDEPMDAPKG